MPLVVKKDDAGNPSSAPSSTRALPRPAKSGASPSMPLRIFWTSLEREMLESGQREIASTWVGERVMAQLRQWDEVAYVRFASVYLTLPTPPTSWKKFGTLWRHGKKPRQKNSHAASSAEVPARYRGTEARGRIGYGKRAVMSTTRYERGWEKLKEIDGEAGERVIASLQDIAPDLARYTIEFPFGDVYSRPGLVSSPGKLPRWPPSRRWATPPRN